MPPPRRSSLHSLSVSRRGSSVKGHLIEFDESASIPSVAPLELMDRVPGYEGITFESVTVQPSRPPKQDDEVEVGAVDRAYLPLPLPNAEVTEDEVREALVYYVSKHCCYGTKPAKTINFTFIQASHAFHYQLETFTERRESAWTFVPYNGTCEIDGLENGEALLPWDIEVTPKGLFETEVKSIRVPHTSSVKPCHRCTGTGFVQCSECRGKGWVRCLTCNGEGYSADQEMCVHCRVSKHGYGRQDCYKCKASGRLPCPPCESSGLILCYIQLTVTWKTNISERIVKKVCLPEKLVHLVTGKDVFLEEGPRVSALQEFPDEAINNISADLIDKHASLFADQKILAQRHRVRAVPTASITYQWKGCDRQFFLYGLENRIHAPNYPQTCCCGCTLL